MNLLSLIELKREGKSLSLEQIQEFIHGVAAGTVPDYQVVALLMAIYFRGLNTAETNALTLAMRDSGQVLKFPEDNRPLADKHSTGGIGDKVSLPLAPLLACLGFRVPMISGRGLGITGGTLDKLDSVPGFRTLLSAKKIIDEVQRVGCVICGQTAQMVPADKKIYALRDASGTVPSIPLITASILSKKFAESLDALILDVKFGSGAFMQSKADARRLAKAMVALGNDCGVNTRAMLTSMNTPLGRAAGNWLEVKESVALLEGGAWARPLNDLRALVVECSSQLLVQTRKARSLSAGRKLAESCLNSGRPRQKWDQMLLGQGADLSAFRRKLALDSTAPLVISVKSEQAGYVARCDARIIGEVVRDLGGGRLTKESAINYDVGVDHIVKPCERVEKSGRLCRVHAANSAQAEEARERLQTAFEISAGRPTRQPLVAEIYSR